VPIQKRKIIPLAENVFAVRGENDKVGIQRSEDMALDQTAKEFGTTPGAIIANNGVVYGTEREVNIAGHTFKTKSVYNVLERKSMPAEFVPVKTGERNLDAEEHQLKDFAVAYANSDTTGKTDGSKMYNMVKARLSEGKSREWITENVLKQFYPGFNFAFIDPGVLNSWKFWAGYSQGDTEVLTYWRGQEIGIPTKDGVQLSYYYDHSTGKVMDNQGRVIANELPGFSAKIGGMTKEEIITAAKGKEPVAQPKPLVEPKAAPAKITVSSSMDSAELERERKFKVQTEQIAGKLEVVMQSAKEIGIDMSKPLAETLKWLNENAGKGSIPRVR
jgi:hypothetical protein